MQFLGNICAKFLPRSEQETGEEDVPLGGEPIGRKMSSICPISLLLRLTFRMRGERRLWGNLGRTSKTGGFVDKNMGKEGRADHLES